jgi:hypothetical protein
MKKGVIITALSLVALAVVYFSWGKEYLAQSKLDNEGPSDEGMPSFKIDRARRAVQTRAEELYADSTGSWYVEGDADEDAVGQELMSKKRREATYYYMYHGAFDRSFLTGPSITKLENVEVATLMNEETMEHVLAGVDTREHASIEEGVYRNALYALSHWSGYSEFEFKLR